jgi:hypothetical protein
MQIDSVIQKSLNKLTFRSLTLNSTHRKKCMSQMQKKSCSVLFTEKPGLFDEHSKTPVEASEQSLSLFIDAH